MNKIDELIKEIMQEGFNVAMGGDVFKSEEWNKKNQENEYNKAVLKYSKRLQSLIQPAVEKQKKAKQYFDEIIELCNKALEVK